MPLLCLYGMNTHKTLPLPLNINTKFRSPYDSCIFIYETALLSSSVWGNFGHISVFLWRGVSLFSDRPADTDCNSCLAHSKDPYTHTYTHHTHQNTPLSKMGL